MLEGPGSLWKNEIPERLCSWLLGKKKLQTEQKQMSTTSKSPWEDEVKDKSQQGKLVAGTEESSSWTVE